MKIKPEHIAISVLTALILVVAYGHVANILYIRLMIATGTGGIGLWLDLLSLRFLLGTPWRSGILFVPLLFYYATGSILYRELTASQLVVLGAVSVVMHLSCQIIIPMLIYRRRKSIGRPIYPRDESSSGSLADQDS